MGGGGSNSDVARTCDEFFNFNGTVKSFGICLSGGGKVCVVVNIDCGNRTLSNAGRLFSVGVNGTFLTRTLLSLSGVLSGVVSDVSADRMVVSAVASAESDNLSLP